MNNVLLKSIAVSNFMVFAEHIKFESAIDTSKKEPNSNTIKRNSSEYNKVSFLYGSNGSGKTAFCRIFLEIQRLIRWSPFTMMPNQNILNHPQLKYLDSIVQNFAFDEHYHEQPITFEIDLLVDDTEYHYEFTLNEKKVTHELLTRKVKRTEKLLERSSPLFKDIVLRSDMKSFEQSKHVVKEEALSLSIASLLNCELANKIVSSILSIQVVSMTAGKQKPTDHKESFSDERIKRYVRILNSADPTIRNLSISYEEEEIENQKIDSEDFENRKLITTKTSVAVESEHAVYRDGVEICTKSLPFFSTESLGTIKLFTTLPYIFDILESGNTLIIDEIENGLHLSLVKEIIQLFMNPQTNPKNAMLICTSHQPLLLDGDFRRDQVWITCKDTYGKSTLRRLSDLKTSRSQVNLINRILENAFGCNPDKFF